MPKGFDFDIPLRTAANLETMTETMHVLYRDSCNDLGIVQTYDIGQTVKVGYMRCSPDHPDAIRVSLLRWKRPYRYIDVGLLEQLRKDWFQLLGKKLLHKRREWLPYPVKFPTARLHESVEL